MTTPSMPRIIFNAQDQLTANEAPLALWLGHQEAMVKYIKDDVSTYPKQHKIQY